MKLSPNHVGVMGLFVMKMTSDALLARRRTTISVNDADWLKRPKSLRVGSSSTSRSLGAKITPARRNRRRCCTLGNARGLTDLQRRDDSRVVYVKGHLTTTARDSCDHFLTSLDV